MLKLSASLKKEIELARQRIEELFARQCEFGEQATELKPYGATACGQFIGGQAEKLAQRGLYGTAAALRVLACSSTPNAAALTERLLVYVKRRGEIERELGQDWSEEKHEEDDRNVIKLSELLYALHFVGAGVASREELVQTLASRLEDARIPGGGWCYFTDGEASEGWDLLPSAYAIRALHAHQYSVKEVVKEINTRLRRARRGSGSGADIAVEVLALYAVNQVASGDPEVAASLRQELGRRWKALERLLDLDLEQNIEYWRKQKTFYVRVPWQLYILSLASQLFPYRRFASRRARQALRRLLHSILDGGFRYPHSGDQISSRTNAIAHEVLTDIGHSLKPYPFYLGPLWIDGLRRLMSSKVVTLIGGLSGVGVIASSIIGWTSGGGRLGDLAPNFIAGIVLLLLTLRRS